MKLRKYWYLSAVGAWLFFAAGTARLGAQSPPSFPGPLAEESAEQRKRVQGVARYATGLLYFSQGKPAEAIRELLLAVSIDAGNAELQLRAATKFWEWKQPQLTLQVLANEPENAAAAYYLLKGDASRALNLEAESKAAFVRCLEKYPGNVRARKELAALALTEQRMPDALSLIREGAALTNLTGEQAVMLIGLYQEYLKLEPKGLEAVRTEFKRLLDRTLGIETFTPEERNVQADGYLLVGEPELAQQLLQESLDQYPHQSLEPRIKLTRLYLATGKNDLAAEHLKAIVDRDPRNGWAYYTMGTIAASRRDESEAMNHFKRVIQIRPDFELAYYAICDLHLSSDRIPDALKILRQARSRFPQRFNLEYMTGAVLARMRRYQEALAHVADAEQIAAKESLTPNPNFYFLFGSIYERNGYLVKAEEMFLKCLELNPHDATTLNYLGYMWAEKGEKLEQAADWIDRALELEPESAAIQDSMGWVLFQRGQYREALNYLLQAETNLPEPDPVVLDHLGDVYQALDDRDNARKYYRRSLDLEFSDRVWRKLRRLREADPPLIP